MLTALAARGLPQSPCPPSTTEEMAFVVNFLILLNVTKCLQNLLRRFSLLDVRCRPAPPTSRRLQELGQAEPLQICHSHGIFPLYTFFHFVWNFTFSTMNI